jgi:hypothetical protein
MGVFIYLVFLKIGSPPVECCWPRAGVNRRLKQEFFAQQGSCDG